MLSGGSTRLPSPISGEHLGRQIPECRKRNSGSGRLLRCRIPDCLREATAQIEHQDRKQLGEGKVLSAQAGTHLTVLQRNGGRNLEAGAGAEPWRSAAHSHVLWDLLRLLSLRIHNTCPRGGAAHSGLVLPASVTRPQNAIQTGLQGTYGGIFSAKIPSPQMTSCPAGLKLVSADLWRYQCTPWSTSKLNITR